MLLFPHNSSILDSMVLCLESFYRTSRARSFGVGLVQIWKCSFYRRTEILSFSMYGKVHSQCECTLVSTTYAE